MRALRRLLMRVWASARPSRVEREMREEISAHIEEAAEDYVRRGLSPKDARRAALRDFGSVPAAEERYRDVRGRWMQDLGKDVRYAVGSLVRHRAFTIVAVLSLAAGIGANAIVFSLVDAVLWRPRAVASPETLVELYVGDRAHPYETSSYPSYLDIRDRNDVLSALAAYGIRQFRLGGANDVEQVWGEVVSGNYFEVLGVRPERGRALTAADETSDASSVVVISHSLWGRWFNSDPDVVGRVVAVNGQMMTIVGVAPARYTGMLRGLSSEIWIPVAALPVLEPARTRILTRDSRWLTLVGRLRPGTTLEQARARFDLVSRQMQSAHPEEWRSPQPPTGLVRELFVSVVPERDSRIHPSSWAEAYAAAGALMAVTGVVLLIACLNLAGMLLARAVARRKELAIRLAVGASRWRIVRQLLTETVVLALIAAIGGAALTIWVQHLLFAFLPPLPEGVRVAFDLPFDWRTVMFTVSFAGTTGILFGLVPALQSSRGDLSEVLKHDSTAITGRYRTSRTRMTLIVVQVTLSVLLLVGAGLTLRTLEKLRPARLGFSSDSVLVAALTLDSERYDRASARDFYRLLAERVTALHGVEAVSYVEFVPGGLTGTSRRTTEIEGYTQSPGERLDIDFSLVGPRYFTNMRVPVIAGRDFDERDHEGAPCVAIVNEEFARRYLAGNALGKHVANLEAEPAANVMCEIVGVVRDDRWQSLQRAVHPFYAFAFYQSYRTRTYLLVHTSGDPADAAPAVRSTVRNLDDRLLLDVQTLREFFAAALYPFRIVGIMMGACGVLALLLAALGVYGVVSHAAAQRRREVGIRMALGAWKSDILALVVGQGMILVATGAILGVVSSVAAIRVLTSSAVGGDLSFGVSSTDPLTYTTVIVVLGLTAVCACAVPALRAAGLDPIEALRSE